MANETDAETEAEQAESSGAKQKLKWIALIALGVILVATLSVVGTWFMLSDRIGGDASADTDEMMDASAMTGPASYLALQPAFIVNYQVGTRTRFLQLELSLVTRDPAAIDVANTHMPVIRNNLLAVLADQDYERLHSVEGKQVLVSELTAAAQAVVESHLGRPGIETVLFRSFVMQ